VAWPPILRHSPPEFPYYQLADSFPQTSARQLQVARNIFVVKSSPRTAWGSIRHGDSALQPVRPLSPWNGLAIQAQTYNAFDSTDKRRQVVLIGPVSATC